MSQIDLHLNLIKINNLSHLHPQLNKLRFKTKNNKILPRLI